MGSSRLLCSIIGVLIHLWKSPGSSAVSVFNVPLSGTATQSSTYVGAVPARAIDGSCNPSLESCSHTVNQNNPWWRLELHGVYRVSVIEVTNRNNNRPRLNGVVISIGNSLANNGNDNPRCAVIYDKTNYTQTIRCSGLEGRYINFHKPSGPMVLCEVKVYGELATPPPVSISIQEMKMNATLVRKQLCWSDALLYCREFHWDLLTIRGPEEQKMIDELVAGAPFPLTSHLWVGLRRSILGSSWFWMSGDPMDFTQWDNGAHNPSPYGAISSVEPSQWRPRLQEEHLNFICLTGQTEGVKKVHFYSSNAGEKPTCRN